MIYDYSCVRCDIVLEKLVKTVNEVVVCPICKASMKREMATPAFRFKDGAGTGLGTLMSIAGNQPRSYE